MKMDTSSLRRSMRRFAAESRKDLKAVVRTTARGFVKDVVAITPPSSQGASGIRAKKQGEAAVRRDLRTIFAGVELKGRRKQTHVFGRPLASPRFHATREYHPDVASIHARLRGGAAKGGNLQRLKGEMGRRRFYVAEDKVAALERTLVKRVGWLAGGWNAAAQQLGVKLPAWVRRHGNSFGTVRITERTGGIRIEVGNVVKYVADVDGYLRRVERAFAYQEAKLERQITHLQRKALKTSGF